MNRLQRRLSAVETKMGLGEEPRGVYEIHYLHAWPACKDKDGMQQCEEHPPSCAASIYPTRAPGRQAIILRGGPWLGID